MIDDRVKISVLRSNSILITPRIQAEERIPGRRFRLLVRRNIPSHPIISVLLFLCTSSSPLSTSSAMRPSIFVLLALSLFTHASLINHEQRGTHLRAGHHKLSSRINSSLTQPQKRCKGSRSKPYKVTSAAPEPTSPKEEVKPSSTAKSSSSSNSGSSNSGSTSSSASGVLHASSNCGASGATSMFRFI